MSDEKKWSRVYILEGHSLPEEVGGYYFRSGIYRDIKKFEIQTNEKIIGIACEEDTDGEKGSWTISFLVEPTVDFADMKNNLKEVKE